MNDQSVESLLEAIDAQTEALNRIAVAVELLALNSIPQQEPVRQPLPAPAPAPFVQQAPAFPPLDSWRCPVHGGSKVVPAGVSAKTGRPYDSFVACPERGCDQKPPRGYAPRPAAPGGAAVLP